jgi:hypothetical protein
VPVRERVGGSKRTDNIFYSPAKRAFHRVIPSRLWRDY